MKQIPFYKILASSFLAAGLILSPCILPDSHAAAGAKKKSPVKLSKYSPKISKKSSIKKSSKQTAHSSQESERAVWLKRAKSSETLTGQASWYGKDFHNKTTASGLNYDMYTFTAAHRTLPIGTIVKVTDQNNGKSVMVCVTDRGPFVHGRIIDLSYAAAKQLGLNKKGVSKVKLEVISDDEGMPLNKNKAFYIKYRGGAGKKIVGPFDVFADAAAMQEALSQAHPEAEVILENNSK